MNHSDMNPECSCLRQGFIVLARPTTPTRSSQSAFYNPPTRHNLKPAAVRSPSDDHPQPAAKGTSPIDQLPSVALVGPDQLEPRVPSRQFAQHQIGSAAVLVIRSVEDGKSAFNHILTDAEHKRFDIVLAHTIDRWSRSTLLFLKTFKQLSTNGVDLEIATEHIDFSMPEGKIHVIIGSK
jgi:hypothetical protein